MDEKHDGRMSSFEDPEGFISAEQCTRHESSRKSPRETISILGVGCIALIVCLLCGIGGLQLGRRYPSNNGAIQRVSKYSKPTFSKSRDVESADFDRSNYGRD